MGPEHDKGKLIFFVKGPGSSAWVKVGVKGIRSGTHTKNWDMPLIVPEKSRIKYRGIAGQNNTSMSVQYEILLVKKSEL
jgi:hypothetical protein